MTASKLHIICPVKNSTETAVQCISKIMDSQTKVEFQLTVYNDFSDVDCREALTKLSDEKGFDLIDLEEITDHPSPNYRLILQMAQVQALKSNAHLLIIESDVMVAPDTVDQLVQVVESRAKAGLVASVTVDVDGKINFPYLYAHDYKQGIINCNKRLSFCCTLLSNALLKTYNFHQHNPEKNWYDVHISHQSLKLGYHNYLCTNLPVLHLPHSSRPWKKLKYSNPLLYYWRKLIERKDKI